MRALTRLMAIGAIGVTSVCQAVAQTTTCGWVLGRWTCETQQSRNVFDGIPTLSNPATVRNGN